MTVFLTTTAQKELDTITPKVKDKIIKKLRQIETAPLSGKRLSGRLREFYSLRAWPYRIIYQILNEAVWIVHSMHGKDVYKH
ncbi:type II toxin-antitoxin system RelE/ParE family toxin [Candidatus Woesebacteria bacterium]|nr:type II toxin-antitoxin system RelE/ParE family toxin [Candidatus Woesebacteria bacterium]